MLTNVGAIKKTGYGWHLAAYFLPQDGERLAHKLQLAQVKCMQPADLRTRRPSFVRSHLVQALFGEAKVQGTCSMDRTVFSTTGPRASSMSKGTPIAASGVRMSL